MSVNKIHLILTYVNNAKTLPSANFLTGRREDGFIVELTAHLAAQLPDHLTARLIMQLIMQLLVICRLF